MSPILFTPKQLNAKIAPVPEGTNVFDAAASLGSSQHGVAARWQLEALGYDGWWIDRAISRRLLHPITEGNYAVGHPTLGRRGRAIAALLRAGEGSALSHVSAARAWNLVDNTTDGPIHLSLGKRRGLESTTGIVVHRPRRLTAADITEHRSVPVTTPERTLRDMLAGSSVEEITRILEQMVTVLGRSPDDLHTWAGTVKNTPGLGKLNEALDNVVGPAVLRSELERRFRSLCQHATLPMPETNTRIAGWEVDAAWRHLGVAIELDSWRFHGGRWQFHRDRQKGLALSRAGFELIRLTWPQVKYESSEVVQTLHIVLARAAARATWAA